MNNIEGKEVDPPFPFRMEHKSQILFYFLAVFVLGVFISSFWDLNQIGVLAIILTGTIILVVSAYQQTFGQDKNGIRRRKLGIMLGCLVLVFALGIFRFNQFSSSHSIAGEFADNIVGGKAVPYSVRGYVASDPENEGSRTKFILRVRQIVVPDEEIPTDEDILITANLSDIGFGDKLMITGALSTPKNFSNDFDYVSYLKKDGIKILMNYPKDIKTDTSSTELDFGDRIKIFAYKNIFAIKNRFESAVNRSIPEPNTSFINGILLGTRQNISQDLKDAFSKTGTSHIMAISGYNIAIVSWGIMAGLFYFVKRKKAFWITVLIIIIFTIMTGASASVVRASIMGLVLLFANGYGRLYDSRNSLLLAGAVMIYQNPLILRFDVGFQLSFLAVMGLTYLMPVFNQWFRKVPDGRIKETITATLAAQVFVFPLLIHYFKNFSLVALPANVLTLPFMPAAMLLGFITGLGGMIFAPLGQFMGYAAWALTEYQLSVVTGLASWPLSSVNLSMSLPVIAIIYLLLFLGVYRFAAKLKIDLDGNL